MCVNSAVGARPVHGQAEGGEEVLEDLLILNSELLAELNEVVAGNARPLSLTAIGLRGAVGLPGDEVAERFVIGHGGVAKNAVVILNAAFGG